MDDVDRDLYSLSLSEHMQRAGRTVELDPSILEEDMDNRRRIVQKSDGVCSKVSPLIAPGRGRT